MVLFVNRSPWLGFFSLAALVIIGSMAVVSTSTFARDPQILSLAVAGDMILLTPLLYWWFIIRRKAAAARTIIPIIVLSSIAVQAILPAAHSGFLGWIRFLVIPAEIGLLVYVAFKVRSMLFRRSAASTSDVVEAIQSVLEPAIGHKFVARLVAAECAIVYYAVASWRQALKPSAPSGSLSFAVARSGTVLAVLGFVLAIETAGVHLLVTLWSPGAAWVLTGLSAYTLLWVVGDFRALALRPTLVTRDALVLRVGLRFAATVPISLIDRVERASWRDAARPPEGHVNLAAPGTPNVLITFRMPITACRYFGIEQTVRGVLLEMIDSGGFVGAIGTPSPV